MDNKFKDPLFVSFILYLAKVLTFGMSGYEAMFMSSLVAIQAYREFIAHKEKTILISKESELASRLARVENDMALVNTRLTEANQGLTAMGLVKRAR